MRKIRKKEEGACCKAEKNKEMHKIKMQDDKEEEKR